MPTLQGHIFFTLQYFASNLCNLRNWRCSYKLYIYHFLLSKFKRFKIQSIYLFGIILRTKFFYWKLALRAIERKINLKEWLFNQISFYFRFKEAYSWPAIAPHETFEQYDCLIWLRILNLYKDWNVSQSFLSADILSIEFHTETVFLNLNSIY